MVRNVTTPRSLIDSANNHDLNPNARGIGCDGKIDIGREQTGKHRSLRLHRTLATGTSVGQDVKDEFDLSQTEPRKCTGPDIRSICKTAGVPAPKYRATPTGRRGHQLEMVECPLVRLESRTDRPGPADDPQPALGLLRLTLAVVTFAKPLAAQSRRRVPLNAGNDFRL